MSQAGSPKHRRLAGAGAALLAVLSALAAILLVVPLVALLVRAPWSDLPRLWGTASTRTALILSLKTATAATVLAVLTGVPLAWLLTRERLPGRTLLRALVALPVVLPPVVGGVALLAAFGRRGVVGWLVADVVTLPFSTAGVVVAETFVAMPFLVLAVEGALRGVDRRYAQAAATLGASPAFIFFRVTLPMVAPSVLAGSLLCWARALGEFGATITFAGNLPGSTQTMPLAVYQTLESGDPDAAVALSVLLLAVAVVVLAVLRAHWLGPLRQGLRWTR